MNREQRIYLAQRARSQSADAAWAAVCERVPFSQYDARQCRKGHS